MKRSIWILAIVLPMLLTTMLLPCQQARAEQGVLRVVCDNYPPWKFKGADEKVQGIDIDLMKILADRMNLKIEYVDVDFRRGLKLLEFGTADIITNLYRRADREKYLHYLDPAYLKYSSTAFYVLKGDEHRIKKLEDLKGLKIGVLKEVQYFPKFDEDSSLTKIPVTTFTEGVQKLIARQIDVLINSEIEADYMLAGGRTKIFVVKSNYIYSEPQNSYIAISKKSPLANRLGEFKRVAADLVKEGTVDKLKIEFIKEIEEKGHSSKQ